MNGLLLLFTFTFRAGDSAEALRILREAQLRIAGTHTLSYHSRYRQVTSGMDDSVFEVAGTVWLEAVKTDTIFGYRFHIRGSDPSGGPFDYYYDGMLSREFRHRDKQVYEINPYADNSAHNPAKARVSVVPVLDLATDTTLVKDLLEKCTAVSLREDRNDWEVRVSYPKDEYGQLITRSVFIDKGTYRIDREHIEGSFNGTTFHHTRWLTDILANNDRIRDSIQLRGTYDYALQAPPKALPKAPLEGTRAQDFTYRTFGGEELRLSALRGKYVLLDFWESWCGWCIAAFPHVVALDTQYAAKGLQVIAVTTENSTQIKAIVDNNRLPYPTLKADKRILEDYHVTGRPCYVLIDPDGTILAYYVGLDKISALLAERLR